MSRRRLSPSSVLLLLVTLGTGLALPAVPMPAPAETPDPFLCRGSITVPFDLTLESLASGLYEGSTTSIEGTIQAHAGLSGVALTFETEGGAEALAPPTLNLSRIGDGESATFSIPVKLESQARAAVHVHAVATSETGGYTWERNESYFVLLRDGRAYSGMGSFLQLDMQAIEDDFQSGRITEDDAREQARKLRVVPGQFDETPRVPGVLTPEQEEYGRLIRPAQDPGLVPEQSDPQSPAGCITVQGNVSWLDENGNQHPAFGMTVQVWDDDLVIDEFVAVTATDANGDYSFSVDNNDGIGQGDRDIYVKFVTENNAVEVKPQGIFSDPYEADSPVHDETPCGAVITENFTAANTGTGPAVNLNECGSWIAVYTANRLNGGSFLGQISFEWPGDTGSANYNGSRINLRPGDQWDWDVEMHEYGHYIQDHFNTEDNPGGPHNLGDCISDVHNSKSEGVRMAWGEGWPTYNGTVAQQVLNLAALNVPRVGDVSYSDTGESNFSYSLESQTNIGLGEDNEVAVQRIFWDLFDSNSDGRDNVQASDITLFNIIDADNSTTLSGAWAAIRGTLSDSDDLAYGAVTTDHQVGPSLNSPVAGATVSPSLNNSFNWNNDVGCSSTHDGDDFTLRFFNASTSAPILSIPVGGSTSHALSLAEFQSLVGTTHNVLWGVEGSNTDSPATGPYLGETFAATVNRPPVADAGPDRTAECASHTATPVQLNGTGSSDPDGDALTFTWSATGVVFDDLHSPTPTGQFDMGTTVVTLTVSDGIESDADQVSITVHDTTPPDITCPADISVECVDHCGTPKTDPQLVSFFAGVSATDVCDASPALGNDAPACLPHGDTAVTFTATDDSGNHSSCQATVHVVDTTPPEIAVNLNRDVLWPPNHKMAAITAEVTVTDICDPNPTFVLTSIASNEPDNGLGDGDTVDDIQDAAFGMPDTQFQLRSERGGTGDGRVYTIIYTASDFAGNTTADTSYVRVPHDQSGAAQAGAGFAAEGTSLSPQATSFTVIILGATSFPVTDIDQDDIFVGNHIEAIRASGWVIRDLNGDRLLDLAANFDALPARTLLTVSEPTFSVGLHYRTEEGDYAVNDIFALGAPLTGSGTIGSSYRDPGGKSDPIEANGAPTAANVAVGNHATEADAPANPNELVVETAGRVTVDVFDIQGRRVRTLLDGMFAAGRYPLEWDGRTAQGNRAPSGMYFYRIEAPGVHETRKISVLK